ncbi:MAG: UMP kinase [bacterium]
MVSRVVPVCKYKRILLKLSGEFLLNKETGSGIDPDAAAYVAGRIGAAVKMKVQTAVVIGGGNIIRGGSVSSRRMDRVIADHMGMLVTVINTLALKDALERMGIEARIQSAVSMDKFAELVNADRAVRHLKKGRVVLYAGGTGNPFFTTDSAAALRAAEIGADVLLKATNVEGVYSADPRKNPEAILFKKLTYAEALDRRLGVMDAAAFSLCMEAGIPAVVFNFFRKRSIEDVLEGRSVGTVVSHGNQGG